MSATAIDLRDSTLIPHVRRIGEISHLELIVKGARCGGCLAKIERGLTELPGVRQARMNLSTAQLHIAWEGGAERADQFAQTLDGLGFESGPINESKGKIQLGKSETKHLLLCMGVAAFGLMNVMMLSVAVWSGAVDMSVSERSIFHLLSAMIALPVAAFSGRPFFKSAWRALRAKQTNMDVPISLAILLACGLSVYETISGVGHTYFDAALMLIFLLLVGRFLDARLQMRTGQAAQELAALRQVNARRLDGNGEISIVPASAIQPDDILIIPAGSHFPTDVRVIDGVSQIDAAIVTGEPISQSVSVGDTIYSGCLNLEQPLTVQAIKNADDSFLSEISDLLEAGQQTQAKYVRFADRAARSYVPIVHSLALLTLLGWLAVGGSPRTAIINAIAVLIITCPCALGLAVPAVQVVAVGTLFQKGIVVKSGQALERLAEVTDVIFDKTGTLTRTEKFTNLSQVDPEDLTFFAALAQRSNHPVTAHLQNISTSVELKDYIEVKGQGVSAFIDGVEVRLGQKRFVSPRPSVDEAGLWGWIEGEAPINLSSGETLRVEAKILVTVLTKLGLKTGIMSGDAQDRVESIARQSGIKRAQARMSPTDKSDAVLALHNDGAKVLMVGDGLNDAPALANAHASASLSTGADISRAASDIVLRNDDLYGLGYAIFMARKARRAVFQNFGFAALYNFCAVPLAVMGFVTPLIAAIAMSMSSLIVTLNALRLYRVKS
jgi:Cu2+-exporting ATPase